MEGGVEHGEDETNIGDEDGWSEEGGGICTGEARGALDGAIGREEGRGRGGLAGGT